MACKKKFADGGTPAPSLFERVKSAITPTPSPNYNANQVAGQGVVGQAQANRMSNMETALAASGDRKYADGGPVESSHNPANRLPEGSFHRGRNHG